MNENEFIGWDVNQHTDFSIEVDHAYAAPAATFGVLHTRAISAIKLIFCPEKCCAAASRRDKLHPLAKT